MAEGGPTDKTLPGDAFAESLYNSIWAKFGVTIPDNSVASSSSDTHHDSEEDFLKAVLCEQLLMRDYLLNHFFCYKQHLVLENTDTVLTLCNLICISCTKWEYFKRLLRCTALIAEFFLCRSNSGVDSELYKAPLIWSSVFREHFADDYLGKGGRAGMKMYSQLYTDELYLPLDAAISKMNSPFEGVHPNVFQNLPIWECPLTNASLVYTEMYIALNCVETFRHPDESPATSPPKSQNGKSGQSSSKVDSAPTGDIEGLSAAVSGFFLTKKFFLNPAVSVESPGSDPVDSTESSMSIPDDSTENSMSGPATTLKVPAPDSDNTLKEPVPGPAPALKEQTDQERKVSLNPNEERKEATHLNVAEHSPSKSSDDDSAGSLPSQPSPDSRSRKRARVQETPEEVKQPSPKQPKPDSA